MMSTVRTPNASPAFSRLVLSTVSGHRGFRRTVSELPRLNVFLSGPSSLHLHTIKAGHPEEVTEVDSNNR